MKTRATVSKFLKNLALLTIISVVAASCGKDNSSGKSGNSTAGSGVFNYPGYGTSYGNMSLQQILTVVAQENPCRESAQQRIRSSFPLQAMNVNTGSSHVGVTPEGDIMVVYNHGQGPFVDIHICQRAAFAGTGQVQAQLSYNPTVQADSLCPVGKIDSAQIVMQGTYGPLYGLFAPINIPGTDRFSQLCNNVVNNF